MGWPYFFTHSLLISLTTMPRMWLARWGTLTQGNTRNRILAVTRYRLVSLAAASQPIKSSRGAFFQDADPNRRQARGVLLPVKDHIFQILPHVALEAQIVVAGEQALE